VLIGGLGGATEWCSDTPIVPYSQLFSDLSPEDGPLMVYSDSGEAEGNERSLGPEEGDMMNRIVVFGVALLLLVAGCSSSDPTASDEYAALEQKLAQTNQELIQTNQELAQAEAQLAEVSAERDELGYQVSASASRSDKTEATVETLAAIIDDPDSFGTKSEVLDLLMTMATDDAVMDDTAFGDVPMRSAWSNTLWGSSANIETMVTWVCDDGSQAGSLWKWSGEARNGEPFELIGVNLDEYNDEGKVTYSLVDWPYEGSYVRDALSKGSRTNTDNG
jgi:hypothetical protein